MNMRETKRNPEPDNTLRALASTLKYLGLPISSKLPILKVPFFIIGDDDKSIKNIKDWKIVRTVDVEKLNVLCE